MIKAHVLTLPRWFALPISTGAIVLGGVVAEAPVVGLIWACAIGAALLAWSHTMNSWNDYVLTGFDKGQYRSNPKPYTTAQNLIAGGMSHWQVLISGVLWLVLALVLTWFVTRTYSQVVWVPVILSIPMTFLYSYGKKLWACETVLAIGFGPLPAVLGASFAANPDFFRAALASIPIAIVFGFAAEIWDQYYDADRNWERGLRNIGALVWYLRKSANNAEVRSLVHKLVLLAGGVHIWLVVSGVLSPVTLIAFLAYVPFSLVLKATFGVHRGIIVALGAISAYTLALPLLQAL